MWFTTVPPVSYGVSGILTTDAVTVLENITYRNDSDNPTTGTDRDFVINANDGTLTSTNVTSSVTVLSTNDASTITIDDDDSSGAGSGGYDGTFSAGGSAVNITDTDVVVDDPEDDEVEIEITVGGIVDGSDEILDFEGTTLDLSSAGPITFTETVNGVAIEVSYSGGVITITDNLGGTLTEDQVRDVLEGITYENTSATPDTAAPRTFSITLDDGTDTSTAVVSSINVVNPPPAPPVITNAGGTLAYIEGDGALDIDTTLTVTDADDTDLESATITISGNFVSSEDVLAFTDTANITGSYNAATGVLTLTGTDTLANYELALESITYENTNTFDPSTSSRTITWVVNDGTNDSVDVTSTITIASTNDAPVINDLASDQLDYAIGSTTPVIIDDSSTVATVTDDRTDFNTGNLTVSFFGGSTPAEDVLAIQDSGTPGIGIEINGANVEYNGDVIGTFTGGSGGADLVITFNSAFATPEAVSELVQNITYQNTNATPDTTTRNIDFTVTDDLTSPSTTVTADVVFSDVAAVADSFGPYTEGSIPVTVTGNILTNDQNFIPDLTDGAGGDPSIDRNWDASAETNNVWNDTGGNTSNDWTFAGGTTPNAVTSNYPGITHAYDITTDGGATANDFDNFREDRDATFEIWIRPDDLTANGDQMIFETGSNNQDGLAIYIDDNNTLTFYAQDVSKGSASVTYDLANDPDVTGSDKTDEFIQIVAAITLGGGANDAMTLYVNGVQVGQATGLDISDWTSAGNAGLGATNGSSVAQNNGDTPGTFNGEIALFRFYSGNNTDLNESQATANFGSVADHLYVSDVEGNGIAELEPGGTFAAGINSAVDVDTSEGGTVTVEWDGDFTYTPPAGLFESLNFGETAYDTFDYTITDVFGNTDTATVTVEVEGRDDITFDIDSTASIDEDTEETATFTITVGGQVSAGNTASVDIAATGTAISGTDYDLFITALTNAAAATTGVTFDGTNTLTFDNTFNGNTGTGDFTFTVDAIDDLDVEGNETIIATLSNASSETGKGEATLGTDETTTTITESDVLVDAAVTIADVTTAENGDLVYTATLDSAVPDGFEVDVSFADVSATGGAALGAGVDFVNSTQTLTFSGSASETVQFTVAVNDDAVIEANEGLTVSLGNLQNNTAPATSIDITDSATG